MADGDITVEILKDIRGELRGLREEVRGEFRSVRDEIRATNERLDATVERLDITVQRLDVSNQRLGVVESTVLGMAEQQRFLVRYARESAERDSRLEMRVGNLETRVERLEAK